MTPLHQGANAPGSPVSHRRRPWLIAGGVVLVVAGAGLMWMAGGSKPAVVEPAIVPPLAANEAEVPAGPAWFRDMTAASGIDFTYRNGEEANLFGIIEIVGGGVAMIDYDGDGLLDLFVTGGGHFEGKEIKGWPCKLYRNLGNWKFADVTAATGLDKIDFYSHGCAVADYDRDGWPDLLVTGFGRVALFHNEPGPDGKGRRFVDVSEKAGLRDSSFATSAGWADLTGRGFPDLYVCHYCDWSLANNPVCNVGAGGQRDVCGPRTFKPLAHALFRNNGDGTFRDVTKAEHLRDDGYGLGVVLADLTETGMPSIYVGNDLSDNHLYVNRQGKLEEKGLIAGVATDDNGKKNGSMALDVGDYDGSGKASIFAANFEDVVHSLYKNLGKERFGFQSYSAGLAALGHQFVGFGASFVDVDNDGWEDLVMVNGHVFRRPSRNTYKQFPVLLRNMPSGRGRAFQNWSKRGGTFFARPGVGRGLAIGDLDNDGWPDVVVSSINSPVVLLRNEAFADNPARWLGVKLIGKDNRDVTGSTVILETDTGKLTRFSKGGGSYLSACDRRILFGLGPTGQVRGVTVKWAWAGQQRFDSLEPGAYWELREGETPPKRLK